MEIKRDIHLKRLIASQHDGMVKVVTTPDVQAKVSYLTNVFQNTYLVDIRDRFRIKNDAELDDLINTMASSIGSLTNPTKLANTFHTGKHSNITSTHNTDQEQEVTQQAVRRDLFRSNDTVIS